MSAKKKAPGAHPKPFDPNATPIRVIVDVLRHDGLENVVFNDFIDDELDSEKKGVV